MTEWGKQEVSNRSHPRRRSPGHPPQGDTPGRLVLVAAVILATLLIAGLLLDCAPARQALLLPASIGPWQRSAETVFDPSGFPDALRRLQALSAHGATYKSPDAEVAVTVYELPSATSAFEAMQTYHRNADEYYFQKGAAFVVLSLSELAVSERRPFLLEFQKATGPDGPKRE